MRRVWLALCILCLFLGMFVVSCHANQINSSNPTKKALPYPADDSMTVEIPSHPAFPNPEPGLNSSPTPSLDIEQNIQKLLAQYGWTIEEPISIQTVTLPNSFRHTAGDFAYAIYWAYNNELTSEIGMDLFPYLGQPVQARVYRLREKLPDVFYPYEEARAVVITSGNTIIGAWIEKQSGFGCSLDRKEFDEIVNQSWNEWLVSSGIVDLSNTLDRELSTKTPEEVIEIYYSALHEQNARLLNAVRSRRAITKDLFVNKDSQNLFNSPEDMSITDWNNNIESAKIISIEEVKGNPRYCLPVYAAAVDFQFENPKIPSIPEGINLRFVVLNEEISGLGWRIEEINSAPGVSDKLCASQR